MGLNWHTFIEVFVKLGPIALQAAGVKPELIPLIVNSVSAAEQTITSGPDKKAAVMEDVRLAIQVVNQVGGKTIDPAIVDVVGKGVDAAVGAVNGFLGAKQK